ncbi:MAG: metal-dependent hydrolase [Patescibacteria group bacterium]
MKPLKIAVGLLFAVLPDIGSGLLAVHLVGKAIARPLDFSYYLGGVCFAFLPDIDLVWQWLRERRINDLHKTLLHYPLVMLPLVNLVAGHWSGFWSLAGPLAILFHYIHDSLGDSWGLAWFWPVSRNRIKFFTRHEGRFKLMVELTQDEIRGLPPRPASVYLAEYWLIPSVELLLSTAWFVAAVVVILHY